MNHCSKTSSILSEERMLFLLILCLVVQLTVLHSRQDVLCPVSYNPDFANHGNLLYPMEIYNPGVQKEPNISCIMDHHRKANYSCPIKPVRCPLIMENLKDAVNVSKAWSKSTSLCSLKASFGDKNSHSRIIILGGSVTAGVDTTGCCNKPECMVEHCKRCSWSKQLEHWLHTTTRANVSVYNLGNPGTTSVFCAEVIYSKLGSAKIEQSFSSRDVFFLDHSFNDNVMSEVVEDLRVERGLEKLIRTILSMAKAPNDLPHIILMETDTRPIGAEDHRYYMKYRKLAALYGLRIYSYTEAIWSANSVTKQAAYHQHLTHEYRNDDHPPWHVHLAYADLVAGLLLSEMNECTGDAADTTVESIVRATPPYKLPEPVTTQDDSQVCKAGTQPQLMISHKDLTEKTSIGSYHIPRNNTWSLGLDKKKRGGLIIRLDEHSEEDVMEGAPIEFPLSITAADVRANRYMIQVQYMRSYMDSGQIKLFFCDTAFRHLDALWSDYEHYRHTVQDVYTARVDDQWCRDKKDSDPVVLKIEYLLSHKGKMSEIIHVQPRGTQLFKLNSVLVCQYN